MIRFDIVLTYLALGQSSDAMHWLKEAQVAALTGIDDLISNPLVPRDPHGYRIADKRPPERRYRRSLGAAAKRQAIELAGAAVGGLLLVPVMVGHASYWNKRRLAAERAAVDLVSLANAVDYLMASALNEQSPPPLVLEGYVLREVTGG